MVHWEKFGHALTRPSQLDLIGAASSEGIFAPTLRHHNGRFYLVTTNVRSDGRGGNFFVWTDDIFGEWSEPVWIDREWFDPSFLFDDDGTVYYTRRTETAIAQARIDITTGHLLDPLRDISGPFYASDAEGPHLYKIGGRYYLLTAEGGTGPGHRICIGRSDSPWGPFEPCPHNPILCHSGFSTAPVRYTGHGDLVEGTDGTWWIVFLGTRHWPQSGSNFHHLGRETFLARVDWRDGWPVVVGQSDGSGGSDGADSRHEWVTLRAPAAADFSTLPQHLRLTGNAFTLDDPSTPAFAGRRLTTPYFHARVMIDFNPLTSGDEAGLSLFLSERFHAEVGIRHGISGPECFVRRRAGDLAATVHAAPCMHRQLYLEVSGDWHTITFRAGPDPENLPVLATAERRFFCTEIAEGWTGCFLGLYATSPSAEPPAADFTEFIYEAMSSKSAA